VAVPITTIGGPKKWADSSDTPLDFAFTAVQAADGRHVALSWSPGKCLLTNRAIPCIHADLYFGDLQPGNECVAYGTLAFGTGPLDGLLAEFGARAERPWEETGPSQ
jgi:hypothetical protein